MYLYQTTSSLLIREAIKVSSFIMYEWICFNIRSIRYYLNLWTFTCKCLLLVWLRSCLVVIDNLQSIILLPRHLKCPQLLTVSALFGINNWQSAWWTTHCRVSKSNHSISFIGLNVFRWNGLSNGRVRDHIVNHFGRVYLADGSSQKIVQENTASITRHLFNRHITRSMLKIFPTAFLQGTFSYRFGSFIQREVSHS